MTDTIRTTINNFPLGVAFTPSNFPFEISKQASVNGTINNRVIAEDLNPSY